MYVYLKHISNEVKVICKPKVHEKTALVIHCTIKCSGDCTDLDARQDKLFVLLDRWICHDKMSYSKKLLQLLITLVY